MVQVNKYYHAIIIATIIIIIIGNIVETVTFQPIQGQNSQQAVVTITFDDNEIALEQDKILQFSLSDPVDAIINEPSQIEVVVTDDDSKTYTSIS